MKIFSKSSYVLCILLILTFSACNIISKTSFKEETANLPAAPVMGRPDQDIGIEHLTALIGMARADLIKVFGAGRTPYGKNDKLSAYSCTMYASACDMIVTFDEEDNVLRIAATADTILFDHWRCLLTVKYHQPYVEGKQFIWKAGEVTIKLSKAGGLLLISIA